MKKFLIVTIFFVAVITIWANDKPLLAVTAINPNGVAEADAVACRSIVETALFKTDLYTVLSYTDIQEILEAQAFSLSGCTDDTCAIEVGKLLAAENIVLGELSAIGSTYNLAIRLIDVASSRTMAAETITFNSLNKMQEKVFEASYKLAGLNYNPDTGVSLEGAGEVYVSAPDGLKLDIFLDGDLVGQTPFLIEGVPYGNHLIEVKSDDFHFSKEVSLLSNEIIEIEADISLLTGNLILSILPGDATGYKIAINDIELEEGLNKGIPAGKQTLLIEGGGWFFRDEFEIMADTTNRFTAELIDGGWLEVIGMEDANIVARNDKGELIPLRMSEKNALAVGIFEITITHPDFIPTIQTVEIEFNNTIQMQQNLEYTENYFRKEKIAELEGKLETVRKSTGFWKIMTWTSGILTLAGGSVIGGSEYFISDASATLEDLEPQYDAAITAEDVATLGQQISDAKITIFRYRTIRDYGVYTALPAAAITGLSLYFSSREARIERQIIRLEEALDEN